MPINNKYSLPKVACFIINIYKFIYYYTRFFNKTIYYRYNDLRNITDKNSFT